MLYLQLLRRNDRRLQWLRTLCSALALLVLSVILSGCASSRIFKGYTFEAQSYRNSIMRDEEQSALGVLDKKIGGADRQLYLMEAGRVATLAGEVDRSEDYFASLIELLVQQDEGALISASRTGAQTLSLLSNDNTIPYRAAAYERILVHHHQAINYLLLGDLSAAGVEIRRANALQKDELERYEKAVIKAQKEASENHIETATNDQNDYFAKLDRVGGKVKNSFQNAYTLYLSGLIYEALGQANDAYIDYKKALQIFPDNRYLQQDVLRLGFRLGMSEDYRHYAALYGKAAPPAARDEGSVVIFYEQGFVPEKHEFSFPVPTVHGWLAIALPIYEQAWSIAPTLTASLHNDSGNQQGLGNTDKIVDIYALAAWDLKEKFKTGIVRQTLRAIAKYEVQKKTGEHSVLGGFAAQVYNIVSERADLRSWLTLPDNAQILRRYVQEGNYSLGLQAQGKSEQMQISVKPGRTTVVQVVDAGTRLITRVIYL